MDLLVLTGVSLDLFTGRNKKRFNRRKSVEKNLFRLIVKKENLKELYQGERKIGKTWRMNKRTPTNLIKTGEGKVKNKVQLMIERRFFFQKPKEFSQKPCLFFRPLSAFFFAL